MTILNKMVCDGYDYVYAWCKKDNIASTKAFVKAGFEVVYCELKIADWMRKLKQTAKGDGSNIIVRYKLHHSTEISSC